MKRALLTATLLLIAFYSATAAENQVKKLNMMSYNIRNGFGLNTDGSVAKVAEVILECNPDVVALQELDSATGRNNGRYILGELAALTGMHATYGPAINYDGGKYGVAIISKQKPLSVRQHSLPGREEARTLLIAEFDDYVLFATHLSLNAEDRLSSVEIISDLAKGYSKPLFLAGDLNFDPSTTQYKALSTDFLMISNTTLPTSPADKPRRCIDYIAFYKGADNFAKATYSEVVDAPTQSDHRPVVAHIEYGKVLRTNPYLQNPTNGGITVLWQTNTPAHSWVEWGSDTTNLQRAHTLVAGQVMSNNKLNKIRLEGVEGGRKYYYRIVSREMLSYGAYSKSFGGEYRSPIYNFELPIANKSDFTAIILNDLHQNRATLDALMKVIGETKYDFTVFNGDCISDPVDEAQAVGSIAYFNDAVGASSKPVIYIRGNHEIRGAYSLSLTSLFDYVGGKSYGAMNWGDTRIVMLDCGEDKDDSTAVYYGLNDFEGFRRDQLDFLKLEHKSKEFKSASCRILINHIPLWGLGGKYNPSLELWGHELKGRPYAISINAHKHVPALHKAGSKWGNSFPVMVGGGPNLNNATVIICRKIGNNLTLDCYNAQGEKIFSYDSHEK